MKDGDIMGVLVEATVTWRPPEAEPRIANATDFRE